MISNDEHKSVIIRTVVVDDEAEARDLLLTLLKNHPTVEVVATAESADKALSEIIDHHPDLVLLDIHMPQRSGFDLVNDLRKYKFNPVVIFVTAYDEYAIRAFKVSAFDYLLKPVDPDALAETLGRLQETKFSKNIGDRFDNLLQFLCHDKRIKVNTRSGFILFDPVEIFYITGEGNYTSIHFSESPSELVTMNLGAFLELLPEGQFIRISRSAIVNKSLLYRIDRKKRLCELRKGGLSVQLQISGEFIKGISLC